MPDILGSFMESSDRKLEGRRGARTRKFYSKPRGKSGSATGRCSPSRGLPRLGDWNKLQRDGRPNPLECRSELGLLPLGEARMIVTPVLSPLLLRTVPLYSLLPDAQLLLLTSVLLRKPYPKNST